MNYNEMTDEQLINRLRNGEKDIIDYLMEKYKGLVKRKARTIYLLGGEKDDLIQEGMIGLFKAIQDYDPKEEVSFANFAGLCISRQMYTAIKAAGRKKHLPLNTYVSFYTTEDGVPLAETIEAGVESNPENLMLNEELVADLEEALKEKLSKMERNVFSLHMLGMDYIQIAEVMEKSPKAIDNALQRIRQKAKIQLGVK